MWQVRIQQRQLASLGVEARQLRAGEAANGGEDEHVAAMRRFTKVSLRRQARLNLVDDL